MSYEVECPYCGLDNELECEDISTNYANEHECECGKIFAYYAEPDLYITSSKAPCMNDEPHKWSISKRNLEYLGEGYENKIMVIRTCEYCGKNNNEVICK